MVLGFRAWIGLNDIAEEAVFVRTDGSPNTCARLYGSNPDNYMVEVSTVLL